jgi:ribosomal protein S18 acetylase RimI-like enzyme
VNEPKEIDYFRARVADIEDLMVLMRAFYKESQYPFDGMRAEAAVIALMRNPENGAAWIFRYGGRAVGYLIVTFGYSIEFGGRDAFVDELFVSERDRGHGIGTRALEIAEAHCLEQGVAALHLEVERGNRRAQSLYEQSGYEAHERYLMTKWLSDSE